MATALAESSVFAALSDYEAHPVAVMEALCVGRPVVGYDIAGVGELFAERGGSVPCLAALLPLLSPKSLSRQWHLPPR